MITKGVASDQRNTWRKVQTSAGPGMVGFVANRRRKASSAAASQDKPRFGGVLFLAVGAHGDQRNRFQSRISREGDDESMNLRPLDGIHAFEELAHSLNHAALRDRVADAAADDLMQTASQLRRRTSRITTMVLAEHNAECSVPKSRPNG